MKKVIVFGATGTVGKHIVDQALSANYQVTAFCRNKAKLNTLADTQLSVVEGDVLNPHCVAESIKGHDVVIIALGSGKSRKGKVRSDGTKNIIAGMSEHGVKRLICQTTLGTGDSQSNLNFFWKYIMFGWFLKQVFLDHELQETYVRHSELEWTIIRPGAFTDGSLSRSYKHGFSRSEKKLKLKISRADVAHFILKQVQSNTYLYKAPGLSY